MRTQIEETIKQAIRIGNYLTGKSNEEENPASLPGKDEDPSNEKVVREVLSKQNVENSLEQYKRLNTGLERDWKKWQASRKHRVRIIRYRIAGIAASIMLLFAAGAYWLYPEQKAIVPSPPAQIQAGGFKATLYTGDKKVIEIKENMQAVLSQDSSVIVNSNELKHTETSGRPIINKLVVPKGGEFAIVLADGTKIWLNADTRLKYPTFFTGDKREVELEGEAYFEVQHDDKMPFIVKTSKSAIRVYGTSFNVKAYPDDSFQKTTLEEGSIGLQVNDKEFKLVPNQQAVLNTANEVNVIKIKARQQSAWRHGRFLFDNENLEDIMAQLARWYDVNIFFVGPKVKNLHFSGEIDRYENIEKVLHMIGLTTNISFSINGKTITITPE